MNTKKECQEDFLVQLKPNKEQLETLKKVCAHVGLYIGLIAYTAIGAKIFQMLESPHEKDKLETYQGLLVSQRRIFLESICNETENTTRLEELLVEYELVVEEASYNGINIVTQDYSINWDYIQAIFFSTTILTTIGYGHFAP